MWKFGILLTVVLILYHTDALFVCPECDKSQCPAVNCPVGQQARPGVCNCCEECFTILKKGEQCRIPTIPILGAQSSTIVCDTDLLCWQGKCKTTEEVLGEIQAKPQ